MIPEVKLRFGRHGLPEQEHIGGRQDEAGAIQVSHSFESQVCRRNRSQHPAIVTPTVSYSSIERRKEALVRG